LPHTGDAEYVVTRRAAASPDTLTSSIRFPAEYPEHQYRLAGDSGVVGRAAEELMAVRRPRR
jgi:hypothetical protein